MRMYAKKVRPSRVIIHLATKEKNRKNQGESVEKRKEQA